MATYSKAIALTTTLMESPHNDADVAISPPAAGRKIVRLRHSQVYSGTITAASVTVKPQVFSVAQGTWLTLASFSYINFVGSQSAPFALLPSGMTPTILQTLISTGFVDRASMEIVNSAGTQVLPNSGWNVPFILIPGTRLLVDLQQDAGFCRFYWTEETEFSS
jgi:hypothetical protein